MTFFITILYTFTAYSMKITSITLDQLPLHELNLIAAPTKRSGKDSLRCVNKALNKKIISQDQLYTLYDRAYRTYNIGKLHVLDTYCIFTPHIKIELIDAIKNNDEKLTQWCLNTAPNITDAFLNLKCIEPAVRNGNLALIKILLSYCSNEGKEYMVNSITQYAAQYGKIEIVKAFVKSYKHSINIPEAICCAHDNNHPEIVKYLERKKHFLHNPFKKKFKI